MGAGRFSGAGSGAPSGNGTPSRSRDIPTGTRSSFPRAGSETSGSSQGRSFQGGRGRAANWEMASSFHERPGDHTPMTETGLDFPFKRALLARFKPQAPLPASVAASIRMNGETIKSIWVAEAQSPVSLSPFTEAERASVETGNFCNFHGHHPKKPLNRDARQAHGRQQGSGGRHPEQGEAVPEWAQPEMAPLQPWMPSATPMPRPAPQHQVPQAGLRLPEDSAAEQRKRPDFLDDPAKKGTSTMALRRHRELELERTKERAMAERFDAPLNSRKGAPQMEAALSPRTVRSLSDLEDEELGAWHEDAAPLGKPRGAFTEHKSAFTERKSAYPEHKSAHAEHKSAHHQEPPAAPAVFASAWQTAAPQPPAEPSIVSSFFSQFAAAPAPAAAVSPRVAAGVTAETRWLYRDPAGQVQGPFANAKMHDWHSRQYFPDTLPLRREQDREYEPLSTWKLRANGQSPFQVTGAVAASKEAALDPASPLSTLFDLNLTLKGPQSPAASSPGPKSLNEDEARFLSQFGLFSTSAPDARPGARSPQPAAPAWGSVSQVKAAQIDEPRAADARLEPARREAEQPKGPAKYSPAPKLPAPLVPAGAAWTKPAALPTTRPLDEIMLEDARAAASRPRPASSGLKSFAELMKAAGAASPHPAPQMSPAASSAAPQVLPAAKPQPPKPARVDPVSVATQQTQAWAVKALRPLSSMYDIETCVSLLMQLPTPDETASFIRANLKSDKISIPTFVHQLIGRRFGSADAARFAPSMAGSGEEEFVTVDRRRK